MSAGGFKRPEGLSVLEAARMACSDVGLDPGQVRMEGDLIVLPLAWPIQHGHRLTWRLGQIARPERCVCFACRSFYGLGRPPASMHDRCLATHPFTEDCGASR